jgi:hypothetical protein
MARASLKSLPALESGRPHWIEGILLDRIGHVDEDSGFDSLQLRFSFFVLSLLLLWFSMRDSDRYFDPGMCSLFT